MTRQEELGRIRGFLNGYTFEVDKADRGKCFVVSRKTQAELFTDYGGGGPFKMYTWCNIPVTVSNYLANDEIGLMSIVKP